MKISGKKYNLKSQEVKVFLALLSAGLWENERLAQGYTSEIDWDVVISLSREQAMLPLVGNGIDISTGNLSDGLTREQNKAIIRNVYSSQEYSTKMASFVSQLFAFLQKNGLKPVLLKGMGVAQCYLRPQLRPLGDVDILLNGDEYRKGLEILSPLASKVFDEGVEDKHTQMIVKKKYVELHGTLHVHLTKKTDGILDRIQEEAFRNDLFRTANLDPDINSSTAVKLLEPTRDVLYVFCHILQHFANLGIGLKQVCDLARLLYTYRDELDMDFLRSKLEELGYMVQWKSFAALMEMYLGMPAGIVPFTEFTTSECADASGSSSSGIPAKYQRKARRMLNYILYTGNMGKNRDVSYRKKKPYLAKKAISAYMILCNAWRLGRIFPGFVFRISLKGLAGGVTDLAEGR